MLFEIWRRLSRFFTWWFGELRACLPNAISSFLFGTAEHLEVGIDSGEARFVLSSNGNARELGRVSLDSNSSKTLEKATRKLLRRDDALSGHVTLRLPFSQVLSPIIELPIAAAENLREVLALEMDRHTPFSADEVLFDFRVASSDAELERLSIELQIARKRDVNEALALAGAMGLSPDRITGPAVDEPGAEMFNLLPKAERPRAGRIVPRLVAVMAVITLALAGVTFGLSFERKQKTLKLFEERVAELRAATDETGKLEEKVARLVTVSNYLIEEKRRRPQMVEILDEVTKRLPDDHWLISYSFRDGTVQLAGYSDDPSSVLGLLEQSELFSEARFAAPVTLDPRVGKERFNVVATVAREGDGQ